VRALSVAGALVDIFIFYRTETSRGESEVPREVAAHTPSFPMMRGEVLKVRNGVCDCCCCEREKEKGFHFASREKNGEILGKK